VEATARHSAFIDTKANDASATIAFLFIVTLGWIDLISFVRLPGDFDTKLSLT
jgi:hypothetical protein